MQPKAINSLLNGQAAPTAKNAAPVSDAAQPFGEMLSREVQNRQDAARPALPAAKPAARENSPAGQPRLASNAEAAGMRSRQETQRAQERHGAQERRNTQDAANAAANANADASAAAGQAKVQAANSNVNSGASPGKPASDAADKNSAREAPSTTDDDTAVAAETAPAAGSAAAALQAIVASLAPRAATPAVDSAIATATPGSRVAAASGPATAGLPGADAADATIAHDPAFDALMAQATQLSQTRESSKAIAGRGLPSAAEVPANATGAAANASLLPRGATIAGLAAKADTNLAAAALPAAVFVAEKETLATLPATAAPGPNLMQATGMAGASGNGADTLSPRVGTPAWDHALGQKVVWMAAGAEQSASLTLNPPDLGPVQVVINVSNAQADASFFSAQPEVRQALEAALPKLKEMLAEAGISLRQTSVGAGSPNQQGAADGRQAFGQARRGSGGSNATIGAVSEPTVRHNTSGGNGLVNTFA